MKLSVGHPAPAGYLRIFSELELLKAKGQCSSSLDDQGMAGCCLGMGPGISGPLSVGERAKNLIYIRSCCSLEHHLFLGLMPKTAEAGRRYWSSGAGDAGRCESLNGDLSSGPLREQRALLNDDPFFQSLARSLGMTSL